MVTWRNAVLDIFTSRSDSINTIFYYKKKLNCENGKRKYCSGFVILMQMFEVLRNSVKYSQRKTKKL